MRIDVEKTIHHISVVCALAQIVLILVSWLWSAAVPDSSVNSLLSARGVRWFFGSYVDNEASPILVWLVLLGLAIGSLRSSGSCRAMRQAFLRQGPPLTSLQKFAFRSSLVLFLLELAAVAGLTMLPHAVLLSVSGDLFPSSFSVAIIPIVAFVCVTVSIFYGLLANHYHSFADVGRGVCSEHRLLVALLLLYVVASQLINSLIYVFEMAEA